MEDEKKLERGITLIALVITIVVLLILAGVAIATLTGPNGIINRASEAREKTEDSQIEEILRLYLLEDMMGTSNDNISIDKKDDYYILEYNGKEYLYIIESEKITEYNNTLAYYIDNNEFTIGDYIDYDQGIGLNTQNGIYTMTSEQTGYDENQTFDVTSYDGKWQILYDGTEGYGVQIISTENILKNEEQDVLILQRKDGL